MKVDPIYPMHRSMSGSQFWRRPPKGMATIQLDGELRDDITRIALAIFTDCVNGGKTFQDAILAVYLSGLENGTEASRDHSHEETTPYTTKRPQIPEGYYMVGAKCECVHAWQDGDGNYYCRGTLCNFPHSS